MQHAGVQFTGSLGRVQIYSFALTKPQITADMRGEVISAPPFLSYPIGAPLRSVVRPGGQEIPGAAPALGALAAVVCLSARPWAPRWLVLGIGAGVGAILWSITPFVLLALNRRSLPLVRARRCGVGRHVTSRKGRFHGLIAASVAGFAVTDRCRGDTVIECASELPPEPSRVPGSSPRSSLNDRVEAALAPSPDGGWLWLHGS